ncbi:unnamed protein product [Clonostachys solani]|uniref:F-box domain-containing protein n=1 Tax=Clonostachys solani TaxID=160281 RepID=A0A9N9ZKZ5_9HYPO|nr:unnamed protein product [Clonostachys solani]
MPPELQVRILSNLVTKDSNDILPILRTCKKLYEIALPLSVSIFQVHTPNQPNKDGFPMRIRLFKFLRYITIVKPGLASHVRTLVFGRWLLDRYQKPLGSQGPTREEKDVYARLIRNVAANSSNRINEQYYTSRWISDLATGMADAIYALLLVVCSGLKEVCIPEPRERDSILDDGFLEVISYSHLKYVLRLATESDPYVQSEPSQAPPLSLLEHVYHEGVRGYGYDNWLDHSLPFLLLPRLRTYECLYGNILEEGHIFPLYLQPSSSAVKDLVLRSSCISTNSLKMMLAASKSLRSFEYMRGLSDNESSHKVAMPRDIIEAIQSHAAGLEHLTLDLNEDTYRRAWLGKPDRIFVGDKLQQMANLKSLVIGMLPLTGIIDTEPSLLGQLLEPEEIDQADRKVEGTRRLVECLPENLEKLEILCCGMGILDEAQELLDLISLGQRFKHLNCVRFIFNDETTTPSLVNLTCSSSSLRLETAFQTKQHRDFDLTQCWREEKSPCSRLHPPMTHYYEDWHKYRYSDRMTIDELFSR